MKFIRIGLAILILIYAGVKLYRYLYPPTSPPSLSPAPVSPAVIPVSVDFKLESIAQGLYVPWSLVFTGSNRILVTERNGRIRQIIDNRLTQNPLITFSEVASQDEAGLMGLDKHPEYASNSWLYASLAYSKGSTMAVKIVRLIDRGDHVTFDRIILDDIPAAPFHAGSRLKFGPGGKLFVTTGDATLKDIAQDLSSLGGKILRLNGDGTVPGDNPFPGSYVYSYGHRNAQGLAWHPDSGHLYATEHGPSTFDGPPGGDEINRIVAGGNYGWPLVSHDQTIPQAIDPLLVFTPAVAPAAGLFYTAAVFPQFRHQLLFAALKGEGIYRVVIKTDNPDQIDSYARITQINLGRIREIVESPDGLIYFTTSNRDGRGHVRVGDDQIFRLVPLNKP